MQNKSWGYYQDIYRGPGTWVRTLTILAGEGLSLHYHQDRRELWMPLQRGLTGVINGRSAIDLRVGRCYSVPRNALHSITNRTDSDLRILVTGIGQVRDDDIIRIYKKES